MPSPRDERKSVDAPILLAGLLAVLFGSRRGQRRSGRKDTGASPEAPKEARAPRLSLPAVLGALAAAAILPVAIYGGYQVKLDADATAAAIALTAGDPDRAPQLIVEFGCGGCHMIDGVPGANGRVGPPLNGLAQRVYVAGVVTNDADNLIQWIVEPRSIDPKTAMPVTGISPEEARHVAAYLYALR